MTALAPYISSFLREHLPKERRASLHTCEAYAHSVRLLVGFAGALTSIGLPRSHLPVALLTFNVGVEIGQLMTVLVAYAVVRLPISTCGLGRARTPALYAIGVVAAYWSWSHIAL